MKYLIPFKTLQNIYNFKDNPILIGGGAMEYYDIRSIGNDLDIIISERDKIELLKQGYKLNLFGGKTEKDVDSTFSNFSDSGVDLVVTLNQYDYNFFKHNTIVCQGSSDLLVISLENLLFTKIIASHYAGGKHKEDIQLIISAIEKKQYKLKQ